MKLSKIAKNYAKNYAKGRLMMPILGVGAAALAGTALVYWYKRRSKTTPTADLAGQNPSAKPAKKPGFHPKEHEQSWDQVDEASWESFPASDPPATY